MGKVLMEREGGDESVLKLDSSDGPCKIGFDNGCPMV